ncbi:putative mRNA-associated protein RAP55 [Phytophthora cinnamomi]|uniref:putative mRNA-associated protein RAP55 n=1 Tax=Phytophthora cinnamomi TaxID=4785 RepID=UPI003559D75C|nr:putative mRNA-associated protein RAP55 [Phytophthora cinnamomi]
MQQPPLPPAPPAAADKPRDGIPYLGSRISLVSKTDIRYEGFLFNIDTRQSTVALQSVRSFGTEGRRPEHEHVPPSPHVLQYATFKAAEIKDLHVCEAAPPQEPPQPPAQPPLPSGPPPPPPPPAPPVQPRPTLLTPGSVSSAQQQQGQVKQQVQVKEQVTRRQGQGNAGRTIPGMGGHLLKRKERRVPGGADAAGVGPDDASTEFNFAEGLSDFDKQQEFSKLEEKQEPKGSYQKSSFFDTISCDALDRLEGQRSRMSGAEERKLNTETFGAVGLNNRRNFRGRGRGRRGGHRNGGWNGGRGGNGGGRGRNNNNNSNNGFPRPQAAGP